MGLNDTGIPGFVGITQRGPTNTPLRITSEDHFTSVYGQLEEGGYLKDAIRGFFGNGGKSCYVLRVAHMVRRRREETARMAMMKLKDSEGRTAITIYAANEGIWGNELHLKAERQDPRIQTFLTLDLAAGDTSAVIKSTHGLSRGTVVKLYDGVKESYRVIQDLSGKTIVWDQKLPLEDGFKSGAPTYIEPVEFSVQVRWGTEVETYKDLTMAPQSDRYVERVINRDSALIFLEDQRTGVAIPGNFPVGAEANLEGGSDGIFTVTPEDFIGANIGPEERYGLAAFEAIDAVDLLVAPDLMWTLNRSVGFQSEKDVEVVQQAMINQCERLKTRFAILDFPDPIHHRRASQWRLLFDSAYAAFYYPWIQVEDDAGDGLKLVPPSGHIAGIFSRCDEEMGSYRAPANEELNGAINLGRNLFDNDIGQLNSEGINCLKSFPRRGIRVWGARTVSSDTQWRYVNVRRVVNTIIASVEQGLQWAVFESNTPFLWKSLTRQIGSFLKKLWDQGYFSGKSPEEAFYVKCDEETNPPELRDAGIVVIECGVAPVRPAEYLVFRVSADVDQLGPGEE